ncbi:nitroreductase/quinone reductase family protein [Microterricola viridarii]
MRRRRGAGAVSDALVASKGGEGRNPECYLTLRANPDIDITVVICEPR